MNLRHWQRTLCRRQTAAWGIVRCQDRRHRPDPETARCCHSPVLQKKKTAKLQFLSIDDSKDREFSWSVPVIIGTLAPYTDPRLCRTMGLPTGVVVSCSPLAWLSTPMVSSNVIALMFSDARMASLSASVGSSLLGTFADRMQHISHRFTLTARRSARLNGEP